MIVSLKDMIKHIYGHRGARGLYPENTQVGFRRTLDLPVKGIELDIVVSKDGHLIVSHEPWMNHLFCTDPQGEAITEEAEKSHNIYKMSLAEIEYYDCGQRVNPKFPLQETFPACKPTLAEVFSLFYKESTKPIDLLLEIKSESNWYTEFQPHPTEYAQIIVDFLKEHSYHGELLLQSFDPMILNEIYRLIQYDNLGLLVENTDAVEQNLSLLDFTPSHYNLYHGSVTQEIFDTLSSKNITLLPWTVNTLEEAERLGNIGIEGIITDYPDRFL